MTLFDERTNACRATPPRAATTTLVVVGPVAASRHGRSPFERRRSRFGPLTQPFWAVLLKYSAVWRPRRGLSLALATVSLALLDACGRFRRARRAPIGVNWPFLGRDRRKLRVSAASIDVNSAFDAAKIDVNCAPFSRAGGPGSRPTPLTPRRARAVPQVE